MKTFIVLVITAPTLLIAIHTNISTGQMRDMKTHNINNIEYDNNWISSAEEIPFPEISMSNLSVSPNPILQYGCVDFSLSKKGTVILTLYDRVGRLVKRVMHEKRDVGNHHVFIHTDELAQGTYFLILETPAGKTSCPIVVLR